MRKVAKPRDNAIQKTVNNRILNNMETSEYEQIRNKNTLENVNLLAAANLAQITYKNIASEDSRRPLTEILHESIDFQNCSKPYILGSVRS